MIFWHGVSSDDVYVVVEHYPARPLPRRKLVTESVPGRSGDLIYVHDAFENVQQRYDIYLSAEERRMPFVSRLAAEWLLQPPGYQRLEDSYDPDVFRLAYYAGGQDVENILNMFGRATVSFSCKPQRFLKAGERTHTFTADGTIVNPSLMAALPLIRVWGVGSFSVGGTEVTVSQNSDYIDLDCELQDAFRGAVNCNGLVQLADFPALKAGENEVTLGIGITRVEITPRWWIL